MNLRNNQPIALVTIPASKISCNSITKVFSAEHYCYASKSRSLTSGEDKHYLSISTRSSKLFGGSSESSPGLFVLVKCCLCPLQQSWCCTGTTGRGNCRCAANIAFLRLGDDVPANGDRASCGVCKVRILKMKEMVLVL